LKAITVNLIQSKHIHRKRDGLIFNLEYKLKALIRYSNKIRLKILIAAPYKERFFEILKLPIIPKRTYFRYIWGAQNWE